MTLLEDLTELLDGERMSISSIARELRKRKIDQHRLILTGYLRALRDLGLLQEEDIPPSKVYTIDRRPRDIYTVLAARISEYPQEIQFPLSIYVLTQLFQRPCFQHEVKQIDVIPCEDVRVKRSESLKLKELRESIQRIDIPKNDIAFEVAELDPDLAAAGNEVLAGVIRDTVDLSGLYPKHRQTRLL